MNEMVHAMLVHAPHVKTVAMPCAEGRATDVYDRHLESFVKTAELGSFAKAARDLYISPNAVIKHVNLLERDLGLTLFTRGSTGVALTPAGEEIYRAAVRIIADAHEAVARARQRAGARRAPVRLAVSAMRTSARIRRLLASATLHHPNISVEVVQMRDDVASLQASTEVLGAEYDVLLSVLPALVSVWAGHRVEARVLYESPASFLVPLGHRLDTAPSLGIADLQGETLALQARGYTDVSDRIRDDILRRGLAIEVVDIIPYDMGGLNKALRDNDLVMSCDEFSEAHPSFVNVPCSDGYAYPICLMYAHTADAGVRELVDALVSEARGKEPRIEETSATS